MEKSCKFRNGRGPRKMNLKRSTTRHIIIKMPNFKDKEKILKTASEKQPHIDASLPLPSPLLKKKKEKVMMENFPNLMREKLTQIWGTQRVPIKRHPKRLTLRHIIIKMPNFKDKERILKAAREKQEVMYKGAPIRLAVDFSTETLQARREWQEIFQVMKSKVLQPRLLYPARLSINMEGQIRSFPDKRRLKEYTSTKPALQDILKGLL